MYFINPFFKDEVNEETETARILKEYSFWEKKSFIWEEHNNQMFKNKKQQVKEGWEGKL